MINRKIRVLHFGLSTNRGGIETYLHKLASQVDSKKFSFSFIDTNKENPCFYEELRTLGCDFFKITPRRSSITQNKRDIEELFSKHDFDIFHCHINTLSYIEPILAALRHDVKVIVHSRNAGTAGSMTTRLLHKLNGFRLPRDGITSIAVSDEAGEWLFGKGSGYEIYNNGIDLDTFRFDDAGREAIRKSLGVESSAFLVGHVGAFLPAKNQGFVLDVFLELLKKKPEAKLLFVGSGAGLDSHLSLVESLGLSDSVIFAGSRSDMPQVLSAMDIFVFPSFYEGFPNAVLEAQACGLPCVVSENVTSEVLVRNSCVKMSLEESSEEWAAQALALFEVSNIREKAHEDLIMAGYSVNEEIQRMQDLYTSLV